MILGMNHANSINDICDMLLRFSLFFVLFIFALLCRQFVLLSILLSIFVLSSILALLSIFALLCIFALLYHYQFALLSIFV